MADYDTALGGLLVIFACVWGGPELYNLALGISGAGGFWAELPSLINLSVVGLAVGVISVSLWVLFEGF